MSRRDFILYAEIVVSPFVLAVLQWYAQAISHYNLTLYSIVILFLVVYFHGTMRLCLLKRRVGFVAALVGVGILVLSFLPVWFVHSDLTPIDIVHHGHRLWELPHIH